MNIALIGDIIGHGDVYEQWNSSFAIGLSLLSRVDRIFVLTNSATTDHAFNFDETNIIINSTYTKEKPFSIFNVFDQLNKLRPDLTIFVTGPTVFGRSNWMNLFGFLIPILLQNCGNQKLVAINQGSTFTHNSLELGYSGLFNKVRMKVLELIERSFFKRVRTYFQLFYYNEMIISKLGVKSAAGILKSDYIDSLATLSINKMLDVQTLDRAPFSPKKPTILMHGFWGPQKNPKLAFEALDNLKKMGFDFWLIVSGGVNSHFKGYSEYFRTLKTQYEKIIDRDLGYVEERELLKLFAGCQICLMPYNASGGQSGILEMASMFDNFVVCTDFPEFREERKTDKVILVTEENFESGIKRALHFVSTIESKIDIQSKIEVIRENLDSFLTQVT